MQSPSAQYLRAHLRKWECHNNCVSPETVQHLDNYINLCLNSSPSCPYISEYNDYDAERDDNFTSLNIVYSPPGWPFYADNDGGISLDGAVKAIGYLNVWGPPGQPIAWKMSFNADDSGRVIIGGITVPPSLDGSIQNFVMRFPGPGKYPIEIQWASNLSSQDNLRLQYDDCGTTTSGWTTVTGPVLSQ